MYAPYVAYSVNRPSALCIAGTSTHTSRSYSKVQHTGVTLQTAFSDEYRTYLVPQALTCVVLANA